MIFVGGRLSQVDLQIDHSSFVSGSAMDKGGIIAQGGYLRLPRLDVRGSSLVDGWAGGNGGLISLSVDIRGKLSYASFTDSQLAFGHAEGHGGAISVDGHYAGGVNTTGSHFTSNTAAQGAAAIHASDAAHQGFSMGLTGSSFSGNASLSSEAAVIQLGESVAAQGCCIHDSGDNLSPMFALPRGLVIEHIAEDEWLYCQEAGGCVIYTDG